jgi:type III secretory pathway component EscU
VVRQRRRDLTNTGIRNRAVFQAELMVMTMRMTLTFLSSLITDFLFAMFRFAKHLRMPAHRLSRIAT